VSFFGNLLKIIAIGAFFVATGPFGLSVGSTLATVLRLGGVVVGYLGSLVDRPRLLAERQKIIIGTTLEPGTALPVVYGRAKVGAIVGDWFIQPVNQDKELYYVAVFCHGSRDGIGVKQFDEIWLDQRKAIEINAPAITITSSSVANPTHITTATPHGYRTGDFVRITGHSGSTPSINGYELKITVISPTVFTYGINVTVAGTGGTSQRTYNFPYKQITANYYPFLGSTTQNVGNTPFTTLADPNLHGIYSPADVSGSGWSSTTDTGKALCCMGFVFVNVEQTQESGDVGPTFHGPPSIAAVIRGNRIYDPRTDTWVLGGSNPALCIRDYLLSTVYGCGFAPALIHEASFATAATYCDEVITYPLTGPDETGPRFTCNGVVDTAQTTAENLQELLSSCRGNLVWEQGQFKLTIRSEQVATPTFTLSPSNLIGEWSFRNAGLDEKWNLVKAIYVEPANGEFKVQEVQWPPIGANAYLTADNGFLNRLDLNLPFTNDQLMAQAIAQVTLNEARHGISCQVKANEEALAVSVGDRVKLTHPTPGWTNKEFFVVGMQLFPDTTVGLSLQEYDATAYSLSTLEDRRSFPASEHDSIFDVPAPTNVVVAAISGGGILITWDSARYGHIDFYDVQAKCVSAGGDYTTVTHVRETGQPLEAVGPLARVGQTWQARVRVVNIVGWPSAWAESSAVALPVAGSLVPGVGSLIFTGLSPVVTPTTTPPVLTGVTRTPGGDGDACIGNEWIQGIDWTTTGADDVHYQMDIDVATDAAGTSFVVLITGLTTASGGNYTDFTGVSGNIHGLNGPVTYYRKYKVKIMRRSDNALMSSSNTSQDSLVVYADMCI
jgi:putative tail protein